MEQTPNTNDIVDKIVNDVYSYLEFKIISEIEKDRVEPSELISAVLTNLVSKALVVSGYTELASEISREIVNTINEYSEWEKSQGAGNESKDIK